MTSLGQVPVSYSDYEKRRTWLRAKAKDARSLSNEEEQPLDRQIAIELRKRMEHDASVRWWQLFGLKGHRFDSVEAKAQFIAHLEQNFQIPAREPFPHFYRFEAANPPCIPFQQAGRLPRRRVPSASRDASVRANAVRVLSLREHRDLPR